MAVWRSRKKPGSFAEVVSCRGEDDVGLVAEDSCEEVAAELVVSVRFEAPPRANGRLALAVRTSVAVRPTQAMATRSNVMKGVPGGGAVNLTGEFPGKKWPGVGQRWVGKRKIPRFTGGFVVFSGAGEETRTLDLLHGKQSL